VTSPGNHAKVNLEVRGLVGRPRPDGPRYRRIIPRRVTSPVDTPPRLPSPSDLQAISEARLAGDHQAAIDAAVRAFGLMPARWDPGLPQEGDTDGETRVVTIGPPAFVHSRTGQPRSTGWLASSIAHETVHLRQLVVLHPVDGGDNYARLDTPGAHINELEAYDWELRHADVFGLTGDERVELERRRQVHWLAMASDATLQERIGAVAGGPGYDYWIDPADR